MCFLFVINPIAHEKLICLKVNQCPKKINRPHFGLCFFPFFPRPFILKLDQSQLCVDLECSHTTIAKDWRKKERIINVHTHTQKYKKNSLEKTEKWGNKQLKTINAATFPVGPPQFGSDIFITTLQGEQGRSAMWLESTINREKITHTQGEKSLAFFVSCCCCFTIFICTGKDGYKQLEGFLSSFS